MELRERRAEAEAMLRAARRAAGADPLPPKVLAAGGYAFFLAGVDLGISILGSPIAPLEVSIAALRGKLQAHAGQPPYRTEAFTEAFIYPMLVCGPEGQVTEAYVFACDEGCRIGGNEAQRPDWASVVAALEEALAAAPLVDFEDRVYDPNTESWIYYGVRESVPFEEMVDWEDPPEWAE